MLNLAIAIVLTPAFNALGGGAEPPIERPHPTITSERSWISRRPRDCEMVITVKSRASILASYSRPSGPTHNERRALMQSTAMMTSNIRWRWARPRCCVPRPSGPTLRAGSDISGAGARSRTRSIRNGRTPTGSSPDRPQLSVHRLGRRHQANQGEDGHVRAPPTCR